MKPTADIRHHQLHLANGIDLHCAACGAPDAPLMLFVHGFPEFWYCWKDMLAEFGRDHHAVAFDLRGHNLSSGPAEVAAYRIKPLLEDLRLLIEALTAGRGEHRCTLVAHDWGGAIAWTFAALFPQYVERLVIINAPHSVPFARALAHDPAQQAASDYFPHFRTDTAERELAADGYRCLFAMMRDDAGNCVLDDEDRARYVEAWSRPGALSAALNLYRASPLHPPAPGAPGAAELHLDTASLTVRRPTLVVWGMQDTALLPVLLDGLDQVVTDLTVVRIPDAGHWILHQRPNAVIEAVRGRFRLPTPTPNSNY